VKAGSLDINPERFWVLSVWQVGSRSCYDVSIQIKDVDSFKKAIGLSPTKSLNDLKTALPYVHIGTVPPTDVVPIFRQLDLEGHEERRLSFVVSFRNGWVFQKLALRKVQAQWKKASHMTVHLTGKPVQNIEEVDPEFPRLSSGEISW
jgi:hypothetical protein